MHNDRQHALFAPSAAHVWLQCPASVQLSDGLPDRPSVYAREGTMAHTVVERLGKQEFTCNDTRLPDMPESTEFDIDEMVRHAKLFTDYILSKAAAYLPPADVAFETKVQCYKDLCWGRLDFAAYIPHDPRSTNFRGAELYIVDYKYGKTKVHAKENPQLMLYAYGIMREIDGPHTPGAVEPWRINKINLTIIQPRANTQEKISEWSTTAKQLRKWMKSVVVPAIIEGCAIDPEPRPLASACRICKARVVCSKSGSYSGVMGDLSRELDNLR